MPIVAITGGIGSGKSVVSQILLVMGYSVYDTDAGAKWLMNHSEPVIAQIKERFGNDIYDSRQHLAAPLLSAKVFGHPDELKALNSIVHPAVKLDVERWAAKMSGETVFVETALLYAAGMQHMADHIWRVTAPEGLRIERVMRRNGLSANQIRQRMASQAGEQVRSAKDHILVNDGTRPLLPQLLEALSLLRLSPFSHASH